MPLGCKQCAAEIPAVVQFVVQHRAAAAVEPDLYVIKASPRLP